MGHNTPIGYSTYQGPQGRGQFGGQGEYCGLSTASEVFVIFYYTNYTIFLVCIFYLHYLVMTLKYSFLNTPKWQYFMLLTFIG